MIYAEASFAAYIFVPIVSEGEAKRQSKGSKLSTLFRVNSLDARNIDVPNMVM